MGLLNGAERRIASKIWVPSASGMFEFRATEVALCRCSLESVRYADTAGCAKVQLTMTCLPILAVARSRLHFASDDDLEGICVTKRKTRL